MRSEASAEPPGLSIAQHHRRDVRVVRQLPDHLPQLIGAEEDLTRPGVDAAAAADDRALGEEHRQPAAPAGSAAGVLARSDERRLGACQLLEVRLELVGEGNLVDQPGGQRLVGTERCAVDQRPHRARLELAVSGYGADDLLVEVVEDRLELLARRRRVAVAGEGFAGVLVLAGGGELGLDPQLVQGAAQEDAVGVEAQQVDVAGRRQRDAVAGRDQVVGQRAVAALAGGLEIALDELAGRGRPGQQAPQLLRLAEPEAGALDVERHAGGRAVVARPLEGAEERSEAERRM